MSLLLVSPYGAASTAGVDEAGRGCLAGPVVAAAVVLPEALPRELAEGLDDSKKLTPAKRERLRPLIESSALAWAVAECSPEEIDRLNILWASVAAMHRALDELRPEPAHILVDGNRFRPWRDVPATTVVGGDAKYLCVAAASILAKTHRDALMVRLDAQWPAYHWVRNKGYPTPDHYAALAAAGPSPWHRRSFRLG